MMSDVNLNNLPGLGSECYISAVGDALNTARL